MFVHFVSQIIIDQYVAQSASWVFFNAGVMTFNVTDSMLPASAPFRLNTSVFAQLIPGLQKTFPNQMMQLDVSASAAPTAAFTSSGVELSGDGEIAVFAISAAGELQPAFTLGISLAAGGNVTVTSGSSPAITGQLSTATFKSTVKQSEIGTFDPTQLNTLVQGLLSAAVPALNKKLAGMTIPIPNLPQVSLKNPSITYANGYFAVSSDISVPTGKH